jgi:hypothetical protein
MDFIGQSKQGRINIHGDRLLSGYGGNAKSGCMGLCMKLWIDEDILFWKVVFPQGKGYRHLENPNKIMVRTNNQSIGNSLPYQQC